jgi:hypothetical protein
MASMTIRELCTAYQLAPVTLSGALLLYQLNPIAEVGISTGFKDTGLKVGPTPAKKIGVIKEATGAVLYEWDGDWTEFRSM